MPLIYKMRLPNPSIIFGIWKISETVDELLQNLDLSPEEQADYTQIKGKKQHEWLAARKLIDQLLARDMHEVLRKDAYGKPHLNIDLEISISHSFPYVAASVGTDVHGIDIQRHVEKISRIKKKFCCEEELNFINDDVPSLHICWSMKEAMYKAWGRKKIEYRDHLRIKPFAFNNEGGHVKSTLQKEENHWDFDNIYLKLDHAYLVLSYRINQPLL